MFHEEPLVTTIFKLVNVIFLIGVGLYFFKTRVLQQIKDAIAGEKDAEKALQDEKRILKTKLKMIEDEIIQQKELCAKIQNNVATWNDVIDKKQGALQKEMQARKSEQEVRVHKQSAHLTALKMQHKILPQALADAHIELEKEFTQQRGHAYMQNIVRHVRRV